jgi:threonine dehydratase
LATSRVDEIVSVTEAELENSIALLARRCGAVVEGAGAAALAAVLAGKISGRRLVLPVCGRNIDPRVHAEILARCDASSASRRLVADRTAGGPPALPLGQGEIAA